MVQRSEHYLNVTNALMHPSNLELSWAVGSAEKFRDEIEVVGAAPARLFHGQDIRLDQLIAVAFPFFSCGLLPQGGKPLNTSSQLFSFVSAEC